MEASHEGSEAEPFGGVHHDQVLQRSHSSTGTEVSTSVQQIGEPEKPVDENDGDLSETEFDSDPANQLDPFDWGDLASRYHATIKECESNEAKLMEEWDALMNFFRVWSESGQAQETSRTFSRIRTRMAHVQHSEERLEQTRQHYVSVVEAFESALKLLKGFNG